MGRLTAVAFIFFCRVSLQAGEGPRFHSWAEKYDRGDLTGAMDVLIDVLSAHPGNAETLKHMDTTSRAIEARARELDVLAREDRGPAVAHAIRVLNDREQNTRRALDNLRASYEHNWRTTPESLLHTCRGLDLQLQITLPDDPQSLRLKQYVRDLCVSLSSGAAAGTLPSQADVHRVSGYMAFQRADRNGAVSEWKKALALDPADARLAGFVRETEEAQKKDARRALSRRTMGLAEQKYQAGEFRAALGLYRESAVVDPTNRMAAEEADRIELIVRKETKREDLGRRLGRARDFEAQGKRTEAVREWLAVLKEDPLNTEARENLGRFSNSWGSVSVKPLNGLAPGPTDTDRERASDYYSRGLMEYSRGNLPAAKKAFEQAVALAPDDEMAARALDRVSRQLKNRP